MRLAFSPAVFTALLAMQPAAADRALLIGVPADSDVAEALETAGFTVAADPGETASDMRAALSALLTEAEAGERRLILLAGTFVTADGDAWLRATGRQVAPNRATVDGAALSVSSALAVAAEAPGAAFVALAERASGRLPDPGPGLEDGLVAPVDIPQGVTLLAGPVRGVAALLGGPALTEGAALAPLAARASGITASGFLPLDHAILPAGEPRAGAEAPAADIADASAEAWQAAQREGTRAAYAAFLERFPDSAQASEARAAIDRIDADPVRRAEAQEEALGLSREDRQQIQSQLTILDYDPRGIDGLFGPNTRAAIGRFQEAEGVSATGYLTAEQRDALALAAAARQAELEAEAERRRIQAEREDRAVWRATGAAGDAAGLRTYLQRYPEGLFAEQARNALAGIEAEKRAAASASDAADWERARAANTEAAYRAYLDARPDGAFAPEARAQISAITQDAAEADARAAAAAGEDSLGLNSVARLLVEQRLTQLGLQPGAPDGQFDDATRQAIRAFQRDRGLPPTGYLSQQTVARMLADLGGLVLPQ